MKNVTKFMARVAAVSALTFSALTPLAHAEPEVSASVSVANMYYWRGFDLGNGDPAVIGDLSVSAGGAYAGIWTSSGDATMGTEYDIYVGYTHQFNDAFSLGLNYTSYVYPSADEPVDPGDASELILTAGFGPVEVAYYHGMGDFEDSWYTTAAVEFGSFYAKVGRHKSDYTHLDLGYAYNENLSFILGLPVDDADTGDDEPNFVVTYTLPIK